MVAVAVGEGVVEHRLQQRPQALKLGLSKVVLVGTEDGLAVQQHP